MTYTFESLEQMAAYFAKRGADLRARIRPDYTAVSKRAMQAEAHGYEQAASVIAAAVIKPQPVDDGADEMDAIHAQGERDVDQAFYGER